MKGAIDAGEAASGLKMMDAGEAMEAVREWGKATHSGKTLRELLSYDGMPLWDMIEANFATLVSEHQKKLQAIRFFKKELEKPGIGTVVADSRTAEGRAAMLVARRNGMSVRIKSSGSMSGAKAKIMHALVRHLIKANSLRMRIASRGMKGSVKGKILFLPFIESQTSILAPVIKQLKADGAGVAVLRMGSLRNRMAKSLGNAGIESIPIESYCTRDVARMARRHSAEICRIWNEIAKDGKFRAQLKYLGIPVWDLIKEDFGFYFRTRKRIGEIILFAETMRNLVETERPSLLVTTDCFSELGKPVHHIARRHSIPTLYVQYGMFDKTTFIMGPAESDSLAVWGRSTAGLMKQRGIEPSRVRITGCPKFDVLNDLKAFSGNRRATPDNRPMALFASETMTADEYERVSGMLFGAFKSLDNVRLVVKLHPRETIGDFYKREARLNGIKADVIKDCDLYSMLSASDLVITMTSTTGLEALIFGKPLITLDVAYESSQVPYTRYGASISAKSPEELRNAVNSVLRGGRKTGIIRNGRKLISDYAYKIDGKSTKRIIKLVYKLKAQTNKPNPAR